ncbi:hypothetical protein GCM10008965_26120 [Methylorubrum aminovorans]|nr:hypothetical protein GCM10025880_04390 [Methylorubrum aminovorans]
MADERSGATIGPYIDSPYDVEACYASKGTTVWSGYKVHLTETWDDDTPNLITDFETTTAAVPGWSG